MDENEQDPILDEVAEEEETSDEPTEEPKEKAKETPEAKLARIEREAKQLRKKLGKEEPEVKAPPKAESKKESNPSELDEAVLDFFELKGYEDPDQVEVFTNIMKKTGMTHREVIKDEYALAKVKAIQEEKAVKDATPSSTKRGGSQTNDVETAIAKFEQTGKYPDDFELRAKVVNALAEKSNQNKPSWH